MLKQFLNHIDQHKLCRRTDKVLLAVSGGVDSMVMLSLFKNAGFTIGVAHCNFQLRGEESNGDEGFVKDACDQARVPFHAVHFETEKFALEQGISIQMAARDLRYGFFHELMAQHGYAYVATAHHLNDSLETVLLNMVRGTGLDGLTGIAVKHGNLIRPLLFATRQEIDNYARGEKLIWREDSSNASDDYNRNLIRNQVIPILKKINPSVENRFEDTLQRIKGAWKLAHEGIERFRQTAVMEDTDQTRIDIKKLMDTASPSVLLWELIKEKGFNYEQCRTAASQHTPGKLLYSQTHQLTIDRQYLILSSRVGTAETLEVEITREQKHVYRYQQTLRVETIDKNDFTLDKSPAVAQLDLDTLQFPLIWRSWRAGDHFTPLGMKQSKKLSDFLIDSKVSIPDKAHVTVLESAGSIVWVVGRRVNEGSKVSTITKRIIRITEL